MQSIHSFIDWNDDRKNIIPVYAKKLLDKMDKSKVFINF